MTFFARNRAKTHAVQGVQRCGGCQTTFDSINSIGISKVFRAPKFSIQGIPDFGHMANIEN
jgi:hypothetical protein